MSEVEVKKTQESLQDRLAQVVELLQRQRVVEDLTHRQEGPHHDRVENLVHRQNLDRLPALTPDSENVTVRYVLDLRIVAFTCGLGLACSVLFALLPALLPPRYPVPLRCLPAPRMSPARPASSGTVLSAYTAPPTPPPTPPRTWSLG